MRAGAGAGRGDDRRATGGAGSTWCPAPGRSPPSCPARSTPGCCCCATTARCSSRDVLEPAIGYARDGYPVRAGDAAAIDGVEELFREHWPTLGRGLAARRPRAGHELFRNLPLADAYERLVREAAGGVARGADRGRARRVLPRLRGRGDRAARPCLRRRGTRAADRRRPGAAGRPRSRRRSRSTTTGTRSARPARGGRARCCCSSSRCSRASTSRAMEPGRVRPRRDRVREARVRRPRGLVRRPGVRRRAARRAAVRGVRGRAARRWSAPRRRSSCGPARRTAASRGCPASRSAPADGGGGGGRPASRRSASRGDTCHLDVADRYGNLVSATPERRLAAGSPIVPGLGFCLGTRAQMFWLTEGLPNSLAPGKRPRTTLTPTLVLRDGEPYLAFGTPGGDLQDQWQLLLAARPPRTSAATCRRRSTPRASTPTTCRARSTRATCTSTRSEIEERVGIGDDRRAPAPRPRRRRAPAVVARPGQRGGARAGRAAEGRREPARDAGLRGRALIAECSSDAPAGSGPERTAE